MFRVEIGRTEAAPKAYADGHLRRALRRFAVGHHEPHAVAVRACVLVGDRAEVVLDLPRVQLQDQLAVDGQPRVLRAAVRALTTEQLLEPPAARLASEARGCAFGTRSITG